MKAYYRLTSIPSTNPSPVYQEDKTKLNELCLKSYAQAYAEIKPDTTFLCDFCPQEYKEMIDRIIPFKHDVQFTNLGINGTCLLQYDLAHEQDDDILFQECDYIYVKNGGVGLIDGMKELGLVVPYDNLNFYLDSSIHSDTIKIKLVSNHHWRTVERTTMTFAIKNEIFKDHYEIFKYYGYLDNDVWHQMRSLGHQMWSPIPALATHMVKNYMAPGINWEEIWKTILT